MREKKSMGGKLEKLQKNCEIYWKRGALSKTSDSQRAGGFVLESLAFNFKLLVVPFELLTV